MLITVFPSSVGPTDMSGKTEVGPAKYPVTSDYNFFCQFFSFCFLVSQGKNLPLTTYCLVIFFWSGKSSSLQDLLSSEILSLLGKTVIIQIKKMIIVVLSAQEG